MKSFKKDNVVYCDNCGSILIYEKDDVTVGAFGAGFVQCPDCGNKIMVLDDGIELNKENLRFPNHYWEYTAEEKMSNELIDSIVRTMISSLQENPVGIYSYADDDNTFIITMRDIEDSEYKVFVATNGYYETAVPFEESEDG